MNKKNIVISAATGYDTREVKTFINSIASNVSEYKTILLREDRNEDFEKKMKNIDDNVEIREVEDALVDKLTKNLPKIIKAYVLKLSKKVGIILEGNIHIRFRRYYEYVRVLNETKAEQAVICDSRDVVFQKDPFKKIEKEVVAGIEEKKFGESNILKKWMKEIYGKKVLKKLYSKPIICSGVIMGKKEKLKRLVERMIEEIKKVKEIYMRRSGDQALLNKLKYLNDIDLKAYKNGEGPILTIGSSLPKNLENNDKKGEILVEGKKISILHQYDRYENIKKSMKDKYG